MSEPLTVTFAYPFPPETSVSSIPGTLSVNVTGGTGVYTYSWMTGSGTPAPGDSNYEYYMVQFDPGYYYVNVSDGVQVVQSATVQVFYDVVVAYTRPPDGRLSVDLSGAGSGTATLEVGVTGGSGSYSYQWYTGDSSPIPGANFL